MSVDEADRESLQAAVRLTIARGADLEFYFSAAWDASAPQQWGEILGARSLLGRTVSTTIEFMGSSPRINRVGYRGLMRGRIDFRSREAQYRNGSGPWRIARGSEVLTASEDGDTEGPPRGEPSPFDVIDAAAAMKIEQRLEGRALGLLCTRYEGQAYEVPGAGAQADGPPKAWCTERPLTCSVWVDQACLIRQITIRAMSKVHGHEVGTTMVLAPRSQS